MPGGTRGLDVRSIQTLFGVGSLAGLNDRQLLERFLGRKDDESEAAFAALVALHSPMVWNVCRGVLPDSHAAEDAFQATFMLLVRKAGSIRRRDALSSWLHGVARRVAVRAKADAARRRHHEGRKGDFGETSMPDLSQREELEALREEVDRLPEKYRAPVLLCHLEGRTHAEAASILRCPTGTVSIRLSRARELLRERLTRRGVSPSPAIGLAIGPGSATGTLPAGLAESTVKAAMRYIAAGKAITTGVVPVAVAQLTEGALRTMTNKKLAIAATSLLVTGLAASGIGWLATNAAPANLNPGASEAATGPGSAAGAHDKPETPEAGAPGQNAKDELKARRLSLNNLKTIGLAMHNFVALSSNVADERRLPAAAIYKDGKPLLSWRVALLPHLDQQALYDKFHLDESWDSPHNKALIEQMPEIYAPVVPKGEAKGETHYQVFTGPSALFDGAEGPRIVEITDGTANTLMVVEARKPVPWTKPDDVAFDKENPSQSLGGQFDQGFHVAFVDGSATLISKTIDDETLRSLITRSGQEVLFMGKVPMIRLPKDND